MTNFPFTNRENEIDFFLRDEGPKRCLIEAPAGYGKSYLMTRLANDYKAKGWQVAQCKVCANMDERDIALNLYEQLDLPGIPFSGVQIPLVQQLSEQWWGFVNDSTNNNPFKKGIAFFIDLEGRYNTKTIQEVIDVYLIPIANVLQNNQYLRQKQLFSSAINHEFH